MATTSYAGAGIAGDDWGHSGVSWAYFFRRRATFEDIVRKPSWVVPVILLTVFSLIGVRR